MRANKEHLEAVYVEHHLRHGRYGFAFAAEVRKQLFAAWIGRGRVILDLGCRDGALTEAFLADNRVTGVDIDRTALQQARQRLGIETVWLDLDSEPLPFASGYFDVVVAGELLEHLHFPRHVVDEVYRVLKVRGQFVGSVSNEFHWRNRITFLLGRSFMDETHVQLFTRDALFSLLTCQFSQIEILPIGGIGGRRLPRLPHWLSQPLVQRFPQLLAYDWVFRAFKIPQVSNG